MLCAFAVLKLWVFLPRRRTHRATTMMLLLADVIYSLLKMNAAPLPELMIWLWHRDRGGE